MRPTPFERPQPGKFERFASERGITLFVTAAGLFAVVGFIALAVDMGNLYTARADCQKIADAAALAGAKEAFFYTPADPVATGKTAAVSAARANYTAINTNDNRLQNANVVVSTADRTVQVTVLRTAANSNAVPTFFGRIFGMATVDVSAMATAEVYRPNGSGPTFGAKCVKPWLIPDRYDFGSGLETIDQDDRGKAFNVKQGDSALAVNGGQYLVANLPQGSTPAACPACGDPSGSLSGGNLYRQNISCCNRNPIWCGVYLDFDTANGNKVGPTGDGVTCLIRQDNSGVGQDILISPTAANPTGPLQIQPGPNNPLSSNPSVTYVTDSDSLIIVPMFDASVTITSGQTSLFVVGFIQCFIHSVGNPQNTVYTTIINVTRCSSGAGGPPPPPPPGPITGAIGSPLPIRLVRNSGT
jgi:putative Flp pilus-assembly TadE/G-like protein